jgi:hypothetical protein
MRDWTTAVVAWQVRAARVTCSANHSTGKPNRAGSITAGFHLFPALETRYFVAAQLVDDRTDDCAFGAMMSLAYGRTSENYVFR